jgi:hypothetical protein
MVNDEEDPGCPKRERIGGRGGSIKDDGEVVNVVQRIVHPEGFHNGACY